MTFVQNVPQHPFFLGRREQNEVVRNNDCIQTHITYRLIRFRFQSPYRTCNQFYPFKVCSKANLMTMSPVPMIAEPSRRLAIYLILDDVCV